MARQDMAWCILRTSGSKTLALANSLAQAGFDVWAPRKVKVRKRPGSTVTTEREMPIAPTFVFARSGHVAELSAVLALARNPHPQFSIFHYAGRIPLIADREVEGLRREEELETIASSRVRRRRLVMGQRVKFSQGAIAGMSGVVQDQRGDYALVCFNGGMSMKIASWLMPGDEIQDNQPNMGNAA